MLGLGLLQRQTRPNKIFIALLGVVLLSGFAHLVLAGETERLGVARDLAVMAPPGFFASSVAC